MLAVADERLSPEWAGDVYCNLMAACHELADIGRAREWTKATWHWLSTLHAAVLFTGICRVHRSQVYQLAGDWDRAEEEALRVLQDLSGVHVESVGEAHYQLGELHRLRGDLAAAELAYTRAHELGRDPQPGLSLLCLAQGRSDAAEAGIQSALHGAGAQRLARAPLCMTQVQVALASGNLAVAHRACEELEATAAVYKTSGLEAAALQWRGAVAIAEQRPDEALPALRAAYRRWREADAVYDAARTCVLLARAYGALGDHESADRELAKAGDTFARLGASGDAAIVTALAGDQSLPGGLTGREAQVLQLVATGATNRQIAGALVLSEKTIARHLSNIFVKLAVSSRTEAAAFAFEHGLVVQRRPIPRG
jgi:DNA-binding NarL/FixJ family response regulator